VLLDNLFKKSHPIFEITLKGKTVIGFFCLHPLEWII